jgi:hypothetical protein
MAATLLARMESLNITVEEPASAVRLLMDVVFDDMGFQLCRRQRYNDFYKRYLLNHMLLDKEGDALIMAVLFKLICKRVGIQVYVIETYSNTFLWLLPKDEKAHDIIFDMEKDTVSAAGCQHLIAHHRDHHLAVWATQSLQ